MLGHAPDGGWWAIGLRDPDPAAFAGVPMSTAETGARQEDRLRQMGLTVQLLPELRDVDRWDDALAAAAAAPDGRFAATVAEIERVREARR